MARPEGRAAFYYRPFVGSPDEPDVDQSLENLLRERVDLRRGDAVIDSSERDLPSDSTDPHSDRGYRHNGIYIFDGTELKEVGEINDLFLEEDWDVGEFTPMYWAHILNHSNGVRFDFRKNLGTADPKYLSVITRPDGEGSHLVYSYIGRDGKRYGIIDMELMTPERMEEFLREIQDQAEPGLPGHGPGQDQKIFRFYWDEDETSSLPLPPGLSPEQFLYHESPDQPVTMLPGTWTGERPPSFTTQ